MPLRVGYRLVPGAGGGSAPFGARPFLGTAVAVRPEPGVRASGSILGCPQGVSTEGKRARVGWEGAFEEAADLVEARRGVGIEEAAEVGVDVAELGLAGFEHVEAAARGDDATAGGARLNGLAEGGRAGGRAIDGDERLGEASDAGHDDVGPGGGSELGQAADERGLEERDIAGSGEGDGSLDVGEAGGEAGEGAAAGELIVELDEGNGRGEAGREALAGSTHDNERLRAGGDSGVDDPLE